MPQDGWFAKNHPTRGIHSGECFGEYPILVPGGKLYVNAIAKEESIVAKTSFENFIAIAEKHPEVWKNMATMVAKRLHWCNSKEVPHDAKNWE